MVRRMKLLQPDHLLDDMLRGPCGVALAVNRFRAPVAVVRTPSGRRDVHREVAVMRTPDGSIARNFDEVPGGERQGAEIANDVPGPGAHDARLALEIGQPVDRLEPAG